MSLKGNLSDCSDGRYLTTLVGVRCSRSLISIIYIVYLFLFLCIRFTHLSLLVPSTFHPFLFFTIDLGCLYSFSFSSFFFSSGQYSAPLTSGHISRFFLVSWSSSSLLLSFNCSGCLASFPFSTYTAISVSFYILSLPRSLYLSL